tara:strand:- start:340 stop:510 length:171 start_codon:yes stop_codon:yes gene_type:complete
MAFKIAAENVTPTVVNLVGSQEPIFYVKFVEPDIQATADLTQKIDNNIVCLIKNVP